MFNINEIVKEVENAKQEKENFLNSLVEKSLEFFKETGDLRYPLEHEIYIKCGEYEKELKQRNLVLIPYYERGGCLRPKVFTIDYVNRDTRILPKIVEDIRKMLIKNFENDEVESFTINDVVQKYFNSGMIEILPALVDYFKNQKYILVYRDYDGKVNITFDKKEYFRINQHI